MKIYQKLNYSIEGTIGIVTLKNPPVNALGKNLVAEINQVTHQIITDIHGKKIRVIIFFGEGKNFSAGADLKERLETPSNEVKVVVENLRNSINKIAEIPIPTIAAVQGNALGGGFELALAADIRIFSESAKVGLREVAIGIIPGAGGTQRLPRIIGYSKSLYWITSAHIFTALEAYQDGVANFLVPDVKLKEKAIEVASEISENAPLAVQQAKKAIQASYDFNRAEGLYQEFEHYKKIIHTKDRMEGLQAFKEKRSPKYQGE